MGYFNSFYEPLRTLCSLSNLSLPSNYFLFHYFYNANVKRELLITVVLFVFVLKNDCKVAEMQEIGLLCLEFRSIKLWKNTFARGRMAFWAALTFLGC